MTEEPISNAETPTAEATEGAGLPASGEDFVSSSNKVADSLDEDSAIDTAVSEIIEEGDFSDEDAEQLASMDDNELDAIINEVQGEEESSETSESEEGFSDLEGEEETDEDIDALIDEVLAEEGEEQDEIEALISNRAQKRIDKLTAEKKSAAEANVELTRRLEELEGKVGKPEKEEKSSETVFSDEQLTNAIQAGIDENDVSVIVDAMKYIADKTKKDTLREQSELQQKQAQVNQQKNKEWTTLVEEYSPDAYRIPSLKEDPDFNLKNQDSKIFRLANALFDKNGYGKVDNGTSRAVREAYSILLETKINTPSSGIKDETEGLKNRLGKEQRKKAIIGGANSGGEKSSRPITEKDELSEYIQSRQKSKNTKLGVDI